MLKGLGDLGALMKMQRDMKQFQKKLAKTTMQGASADNAVTAVVNGEFQLRELAIGQGLAASADARKIEKAVVEAVNDAIAKIKEHSARQMTELTGGMDLGMFMK